MQKKIDDVRYFWNKNPLFSGEIEENIGTQKWFEKLDDIKINDCLSGRLSDWIPDNIENKRLLDIGCGPGFWTRIFGKLPVEYYGIDISSTSVELAKKSQEIFNLKGKVIEGNAENLDFPDEYFDYVISEGVIHHTPDTQKCIDEIYRVLVKGGSAVISVYHKKIFFRSKILFKLLVLILKIFGISLKGRNREKMLNSQNAEEFVRIYDGFDNPIGKAYTVKELKNMCCRFSEISFAWYYIPIRAVKFKLPQSFFYFLSKYFGLLIMVKLKK